MARLAVLFAIVALFACVSAQKQISIAQWGTGGDCVIDTALNFVNVPNDACVLTPQLSIKMTETQQGTVNYNYGCNADCSSCLVTGTTSYDTCVQVVTPAGTFPAMIFKTRAPAYATSQVFSDRSTDKSTCLSPQAGTSVTVQSGVCFQESVTGKWSRYTAVTSTAMDFAFQRNCSDNTCTICYTNALYAPLVPCARLNDLTGGSSDFFNPSTVIDGTPAATTTQAQTTQAPGSSSAVAVVASVAVVVVALALAMF